MIISDWKKPNSMVEMMWSFLWNSRKAAFVIFSSRNISYFTRKDKGSSVIFRPLERNRSIAFWTFSNERSSMECMGSIYASQLEFIVCKCIFTTSFIVIWCVEFFIRLKYLPWTDTGFIGYSCIESCRTCFPSNSETSASGINIGAVLLFTSFTNCWTVSCY